MKAATILLSSLIAVVSANVAQRQASSASSVATTTNASLTPQATCLAACQPSDVNCQAACVGTAHPNSAQVNQTNECAAQCPQGDGSTSDSQKYASCVQSCISSYFPTSQTVSAGGASGATGSVASNAASATGTAASGASTTTGTGASKSSGTGSSNSGAGTSTAAGSAAASSSKAAAPNNAPIMASAGGVAGLFVAIFAW